MKRVTSLIICVAVCACTADVLAESNGTLGSTSAGKASISLTIPARMELKKSAAAISNRGEAFCVKGIGIQGYYVDLFTASDSSASLNFVSRSKRRTLSAAARQPVTVSAKGLMDCAEGISGEFLEVKLSSLKHSSETVLIAEPL